MTYVLKRIVAALVAPFTLGYSTCRRCKRPWPVCKEHTTYYVPNSRGMFPLCESCWKELKTPEKRLPYYLGLIDDWEASQAGRPYEDIRKSITLAVNDGQ